MKILLFTKNGKLLLVDKTNKERKKIDSLQHYLDCPVRLEKDISFETFLAVGLNKNSTIGTRPKNTITGM